MTANEELVFGLVEADYIAAKMALDMEAYLLASDSDYYMIEGLKSDMSACHAASLMLF